MVTMEEFAAELVGFSARREVVNEIRRELRKPLPALRADFRANALGTLPARGGLGGWVAASRISIRFKDSGRSAGVYIKVSKKAGDGDKADLDRLDTAGRVRHPLYGNRRYWFGQTVPPGVFTNAFNAQDWLEHVDRAFDHALDKIRRG